MTETQATFTGGDQAPQVPEQQTLFALEELTVATVTNIATLTEEAKKLSQMIADGLSNDALFKEHNDNVKTVQKVRAQTKGEIMKQPGVVELVNKLKGIRSEIKEKKLASSDYALEINRMSGQDEIEVNGEFYQIVKTAKLVKAMKKQ